jgi:predicted dinucleotide-binding enzyme
VIVDPTNPVGPDSDGNYRKVIPEQESSGQILAGRLPAGARLVKAFGTLSAPTLAAAARREPERAVLFYATDDAAAGDLIADLIRARAVPSRSVWGAWTRPSASRCTATCTNTAPWAGP